MASKQSGYPLDPRQLDDELGTVFHQLVSLSPSALTYLVDRATKPGLDATRLIPGTSGMNPRKRWEGEEGLFEVCFRPPSQHAFQRWRSARIAEAEQRVERKRRAESRVTSSKSDVQSDVQAHVQADAVRGEVYVNQRLDISSNPKMKKMSAADAASVEDELKRRERKVAEKAKLEADREEHRVRVGSPYVR